MFTKEPTEKSGLEKAIDSLLNEMNSVNADSTEYVTMADQLVKLYNLKTLDEKKRVDPNQLILVAGHLIGITMIVGHERANVITSKAVNFVTKLL